MKISFSKNFSSLPEDELKHIFRTSDYIPIVVIPNLPTSNDDLEFDARDVYFVPKNDMKLYTNFIEDEEYCIMEPSSYTDVILTNDYYASRLWKAYSLYNPDEHYKDIKKVLNFACIFKVLSPGMCNHLQEIIDKERLALSGTVQLLNNFPDYWKILKKD